jgi:2-desacetyl-2-hydroxyethyl bacteriochlorophyllide A dehydrogenase
MKSLSLTEPGQFTFVNVPKPEISENHTLVKVLSCGVCGSDIHAMSGKQPFFSYPRRLGHELCVEVVQSHPSDEFTVGDRCVIEPYYFCGECIACRMGKTNCCSNLSVLGIHFDGGHTSHISVLTKYLHKANELTIEQAALVEPLAIGCHAVERANIKLGEPVAILGMGTIGIAAALFVKAIGGNPVVVDIEPSRLDFAKNVLNFDTCLMGDEHLQENLQKHFGQLPEVIVDATGNKHSMNNCFNLVEFGGRVVFVGLFRGDVTIDSHNFHLKEITLLASRAALSSEFKKVIDAISNQVMDPTAMINERLQFSALDKELIQLAGKPGLIKAMIHY